MAGVSPLSTTLRIPFRAPATRIVITQISHLCITTSGFEGASLLEVFTFEEELFASSEAVEGGGGEDRSVVEVTGHPAGSCLYVRQCDAHGEGEGGSESCVLHLRTVSGQSDLESVKTGFFLLELPSTAVVFVHSNSEMKRRI